mgnify:CR=1 FL=1
MISVVTGASSGIGAEAAVLLAAQGHEVALVGRTPGKLRAVADRVAAATGVRPATFEADYTSFDSVRALAETLLDRYPHIDVFVNNAGVMTTERRLTGDGHEMIMQVNHLSPFLLTYLLLERLEESGARVVNTASQAAATGRLDPDDLDRSRRRWSAWLQYGDSKQANVLFTTELARRYSRITPVSVHPGVLRTAFAAGTFYMWLICRVPGMSQDPREGGAVLAHVATHPDVAARRGGYFNRRKPGRLTRRMSDPELAAALWTASLRATGLS